MRNVTTVPGTPCFLSVTRTSSRNCSEMFLRFPLLALRSDRTLLLPGKERVPVRRPRAFRSSRSLSVYRLLSLSLSLSPRVPASPGNRGSLGTRAAARVVSSSLGSEGGESAREERFAVERWPDRERRRETKEARANAETKERRNGRLGERSYGGRGAWSPESESDRNPAILNK